MGEAPLHVKKVEPEHVPSVTSTKPHLVPHGSFGPPGLPPSYSKPPYWYSSSSLPPPQHHPMFPLEVRGVRSQRKRRRRRRRRRHRDFLTIQPYLFSQKSTPTLKESDEALNAGNFGRVATLISREKPLMKSRRSWRKLKNVWVPRGSSNLESLQKQLPELQSVLSLLVED